MARANPSCDPELLPLARQQFHLMKPIDGPFLFLFRGVGNGPCFIAYQCSASARQALTVVIGKSPFLVLYQAVKVMSRYKSGIHTLLLP